MRKLTKKQIAEYQESLKYNSDHVNNLHTRLLEFIAKVQQKMKLEKEYVENFNTYLSVESDLEFNLAIEFETRHTNESFWENINNQQNPVEWEIVWQKLNQLMDKDKAEVDRQIKYQKLRESALAKLTPEEREALLND